VSQQQQGFLVLDFGSQLTQLIARRLRELGHYSEIHPFNFPLEKIQAMKPQGIILSGGPNSVYETEAPHRDVKELLDLAPLFGICYGMQLLAHDLGGKVEKSSSKEYGFNKVSWTASPRTAPLLKSFGEAGEQKVWMSHGDIVHTPPTGCEVAGKSESGHIAAFLGERMMALQFHPEVAHTEHGEELLKYFCENMCHAKADWNAPQIVDHLKEKILAQVGETDHVLCGLSGGVDSSVVATLLTKTLGPERVHCVFVNNGLLRKHEYDNVMSAYKAVGLNVKGVDASAQFLGALKGLTDPEQKRKAIGRVFIEVFEQALDPKWPIKFLAQGTLYPDVIESVSFKGGPSHTIKSHHNVGGLPEKMKLKLVEPVRELFKDEVRKIGTALGLPKDMIGRHPFPGPGLAIRVMGEVTPEAVSILQEADHIFIQKLREKGLYDQIWQAFCVLLPIKTVGVQGDGRTYAQVLSLRAVTSTDGMTADWYPFSFEFLREVSNEITNKVHAVNRVVYDVTSKPPATIEWE
jgi:GMP synthase (glutamine-hydrolysing)